MKTQLDLTENFLRSQKTLYRSYCESLQDAMAEQQIMRNRDKARRRMRGEGEVKVGSVRDAR
jgi:hypothetical protein